jgi:hypothetical protein
MGHADLKTLAIDTEDKDHERVLEARVQFSLMDRLAPRRERWRGVAVETITQPVRT